MRERRGLHKGGVPIIKQKFKMDLAIRRRNPPPLNF